MARNFHHCPTLVSSELCGLLFFKKKQVIVTAVSDQFKSVADGKGIFSIYIEIYFHLIETSDAAEIVLCLTFDCHACLDTLKNILHQPYFGQSLKLFYYLE